MRPELELFESEIGAEPISAVRAWWIAAREIDPSPEGSSAMAVASVGANGSPSNRIVLLRALDQRGFVFYTNYEGRKGSELRAGNRAALVIHWADLGCQVRVEGAVEHVSAEESDAYFATRPRGHQIGAWVSPQSTAIADRKFLEDRLAEMEQRFAGENLIPRPEYWGGIRVVPDVVELWGNRADRLHDRLRFTRDGGTWIRERLAP
jgi:pyridoxamine 5'-phosphate oxidase